MGISWLLIRGGCERLVNLASKRVVAHLNRGWTREFAGSDAVNSGIETSVVIAVPTASSPEKSRKCH
jgi:hypothetical protein